MARTKQTARKTTVPKEPRKAGSKQKAAGKAPRKNKAAGGGAGAAAGGAAPVKKPHRYRPGTVALRQIKQLQSTTGTIFPRVAFFRLVREVVEADRKNEVVPGVVPKEGFRYQGGALAALQTLSESFLTRLFVKGNLIALANNRVTCRSVDLMLAYKIGVPLSENIREPVFDAMNELPKI